VTTDGGSYDKQPPPSQHADEQAYQEDIVTQSIPTKTGDEDPWLYDSERPVSAGTACTDEYDFDAPQSDDEAIATRLSANTAARPTNVTNAAESRAGGNFLPKPVVSDVPNASEGFSFTKPNHPTMNFIPTRPAPASQMLPTPRLTGDRETRDGSPDELNAEGLLS
jgi:hypothetical protein